MSARRIVIQDFHPTNPHVISVRCPHCGREGSFEGVEISDISGINRREQVPVRCLLGIRRCPNPECRGQLYIEVVNNELTTFPKDVIGFDSSDIPDRIVSVFEEALVDEANDAHTSAAIMVRKTLELICADRAATGDNLKARIDSLKSQVILPTQLFEAMDNLRLLGNDAAHIESQVFDDVGKEEVRLAIDLTKEILKAIYQLDSIVGRLQAMKRGSSESL